MASPRPHLHKVQASRFTTGKDITIKAKIAAGKRMALGIIAPDIQYKKPPSLVIALQVRSPEDTKWGNISAFNIHEYTPDPTLNKYREELTNLQIRWMRNGYFGPNATFRIKQVTQPASVSWY